LIILSIDERDLHAVDFVIYEIELYLGCTSKCQITNSSFLVFIKTEKKF